MQFKVKAPITRKSGSECLVLPILAGKRPGHLALDPALETEIDTALAEGDLAARAGSTLMLRPAGAFRRVVLVSAGEAELASGNTFRDVVQAGWKAVAATGATEVSTLLHEIPVQSRDLRWKLAHEVLLARAQAYRFNRHRSKPDAHPPRVRKVVFPVAKEQSDAASEEVQRMVSLADGMDFCRDLGNTAPNICHPTWLAGEARSLAKEFKLKHEVLDEADMAKLGMGALLAVGQGSAQPPRLIALHYRGGESKDRPVVLVGKGITFDTGGISIKPAADMDEMKFDMCGAATVLGVMRAVAGMALPINLSVVVAAAENMPAGNATRPGDIVTTMSGQTVEILNTDAEGRLVLCDALTWAQKNLDPEVVVDVATLTGACIIALGSHHAGLFSNDDALAGRLLSAGQDMHDSAWRMPLDEVYNKSLRSTFADMGNIGGRAAGSVTAACFLQRFIDNDRAWAHLDIAGVAWSSGASKAASARPVALLTRWLIARAA